MSTTGWITLSLNALAFPGRNCEHRLVRNPLILSLCLCVLLMLLSPSNLAAQHPVGYGAVKASSQIGSFSFKDLDRVIVLEKTAAFFIDEALQLTFEVLVTATGEVKYVRAPRMERHLYEMRLACTSALYGFRFAPLPESGAEKWYKAELRWEAE